VLERSRRHLIGAAEGPVALLGQPAVDVRDVDAFTIVGHHVAVFPAMLHADRIRTTGRGVPIGELGY
jgi:hypothetical protein